jgi:O-antigen/teichoic acid export membrane protein
MGLANLRVGTGALSQIYWRVDLLLLPLLRNLNEIGLFAAADKLTDLGLKVGVLCTRVLAPVLFTQSQQAPELYARTCKITLRAASLAGTFACLLLAFLAEPLLSVVFGATFRPAAAVLIVLAASLAVRFVVITLQMILSASDEHFRRTGALALAIGGAGVFNVVLVPTYGIVGAARARLISDVIHVGAMLSARGLPFRRRAAVSWMLLPPVLGACAYLAAQSLHTALIPSVFAGVGLYALGIVTLRAVRLTELRELVHHLRVRSST